MMIERLVVYIKKTMEENELKYVGVCVSPFRVRYKRGKNNVIRKLIIDDKLYIGVNLRDFGNIRMDFFINELERNLSDTKVDVAIEKNNNILRLLRLKGELIELRSGKGTITIASIKQPTIAKHRLYAARQTNNEVKKNRLK